MSLFDSLPQIFRGSFTSLIEWHMWCAEIEMSVEERLGARDTWAGQYRKDPTGFNNGRYGHLGSLWIDTPRFEKLRRQVADILWLNHTASGVRDPIAIDSAIGNYGKTIFIARLLRDWYHASLEAGRRLPQPDGENNIHEPVIFTTCDSSPRSSRSDEAILEFVNAEWGRLRVSQLPALVKRHVLRLDTSVIVLDDIQELRRWRVSDEEMSGHIKHLMSLLPVTMILVGYDMVGNKILTEGEDGVVRLSTPRVGKGRSSIAEVIASTSSTEGRVTHIVTPSFGIETFDDRQEWMACLSRWESELPLLKLRPDTLTEAVMAAYIWERTSGVTGSIAKLLRRATLTAIQSGKETITRALLDATPIDAAAERNRAVARTKLASLQKEFLAASESAKA